MKKIMIVDDEPMILKMGSFILHKAGLPAVTVTSAKEAIELLKDGDIEFIFMDIEMPELNGIDAVKMIRADESIAEVPICLMSGTVTDDLIIQGCKLGTTGCITKPLSAEEMYTALDSAGIARH